MSEAQSSPEEKPAAVETVSPSTKEMRISEPRLALCGVFALAGAVVGAAIMYIGMSNGAARETKAPDPMQQMLNELLGGSAEQFNDRSKLKLIPIDPDMPLSVPQPDTDKESETENGPRLFTVPHTPIFRQQGAGGRSLD